LYAGNKFKGTYRNCGKIGHKASESGGNRLQGDNNQSNMKPAVTTPATGDPNPNASSNNQGGDQ
jgi:hypothetical protein